MKRDDIPLDLNKYQVVNFLARVELEVTKVNTWEKSEFMKIPARFS